MIYKYDDALMTKHIWIWMLNSQSLFCTLKELKTEERGRLAKTGLSFHGLVVDTACLQQTHAQSFWDCGVIICAAIHHNLNRLAPGLSICRNRAVNSCGRCYKIEIVLLKFEIGNCHPISVFASLRAEVLFYKLRLLISRQAESIWHEGVSEDGRLAIIDMMSWTRINIREVSMVIHS